MNQSTQISEIKTLLPTCMLQERIRITRQLKKWQRARRRDPKVLQRLKNRAEASARLLEKRRQSPLQVTYPEDLPLTARKDEILQAIKDHPVVIVAGETGSGKTTQLPKICLEAGLGVEAKIACTQPRRVAALSVSRRIAEELGVSWGQEVGCKIRFSDETGSETRIKMMTDGMLLAEVQNDPSLYEYDTIIIDEAHERSLNIDFLLGYLRVLRKKRPDLKIVITSATIDTETFAEAFEGAPVIEVSGRMYPVDIRYWPLDEGGRDSDEYTYIDAALDVVDNVVMEERRGDILVFMPTEKDIHEIRRRLSGRSFPNTDILPLFGRLTAADQQRVFQPQKRRRIVVATNIAETSLTIPGIRYVVDTGLSRMSRYNARTQTHRLPIEAIAQSSARQRAGRCGRVADGICIRLYSEEDLEERPEYTQPEIQRSNLAEVILRMLSIRLGDIQTFPFIDPPRPQAINGGFQLLQELGALDESRQLTTIGRQMARLPIAPTVSRMVLQAQEEGVLADVLIIASAISIQDPRIRPEDKQQEADQEHKKFQHAESDFLSLLNIWNAYHGMLEGMTSQSRMRQFCKTHYLSYNRMREWRDIHVQLRRTLKEIGGFKWQAKEMDYDGVHRSILCGLLSNIGQKKEHNFYRGARERDVMLFPGSGLFQRKTGGEKSEPQGTQEKRGGRREEQSKNTPGWIVAAEMVETSRIFARTAARIQPRWIVDLGQHLCRTKYGEPFWDEKGYRVMTMETVTLYGLQILKRQVSYHHVNAEEATEIFIREALVNDTITTPFEFLEHNRTVRQELETREMMVRYSGQSNQLYGFDINEAMYRYYAAHLSQVSSLKVLDRLIRERQKENSEFLFMKVSELVEDEELVVDRSAFPPYLQVEDNQLPYTYAYRPGQDEDGVTLTVPHDQLHILRPDMLEWLVPGLLPEKIMHLLRSLPKAKRRRFVPIPESARRIASELRPTHPSLLESLEAYIMTTYNLEIFRFEWREENLPKHLKMRLCVQGGKEGKDLISRDVESILNIVKNRAKKAASDAWTNIALEWEQHDLRSWTFGDLPERIEINAGDLPVYGYPGLLLDDDIVNVHLFRDKNEAELETQQGLFRLYEVALQEDLAWLRRDLQDLQQFQALCVHAGGVQALQDAAYTHLTGFLFSRPDLYPLTQSRFEEEIEEARELIPGLMPRFLDQLGTLDEVYREIRQYLSAFPALKADLTRLLPPDFLATVPYTRLSHLCRYLKALRLRGERARVDAVKDQKKAEQILPFQASLDRLMQDDRTNVRQRILIEEYRWMLEEFRVSVFAQELGTPQPISEKRLNKKLEEIGGQG